MTTVLVTGAAGYVGSRLVQRLAASTSVEPRALVRNLVPYLPQGLQVVADILGPEDDAAQAFREVDAVVHLAAPNEVAAARQPERALTETIRIAHRVGQYATAAGVRRVVYVSTIHVYGSAIADGAVLSESTVPDPLSIYAIARLSSEYLLRAAGPSVEVVVLRLTNSVGAPIAPSVDRWSLIANDLCRQAVLTGCLTLRTHGFQWRDFVALGDVSRTIDIAAGDTIVPGTYNLGMGESMTIRALAALVQDVCKSVTGRKPELIVPDPPASVPQPYRVAVDRLASVGVSQTATVRSAVEETVRFCVENRKQL